MSIDNYLKENIISHNAKVDLGILREFRREHDPHIEKKGLEAVASDYTYSYTPTSCGILVSIKCRCGKEGNITDYSVW